VVVGVLTSDAMRRCQATEDYGSVTANRKPTFLAVAMVCLVLGTGVLWLILRLPPSDEPRWAHQGELREACDASQDFYTGLREFSPVSLPDAEAFGSDGEVHRTQQGRPCVHVTARLVSDLSDGHRTYTGVGFDYDLFSREIISFKFFAPGAAVTPYGMEFSNELCQNLVIRAKELSASLGDDEFTFDYATPERRGRGVEVHFDRIVDGVQYINDRYELLLTREGVLLKYLKRREWARLESTEHLPEGELVSRSRAYAAEMELTALESAADVEIVECSLAAGDMAVMERVARRDLCGFLRPRALFVSVWIRKGRTRTYDNSAALLRIFIDARTGELLRRDGAVYPLEEVLDRAGRLF